MSSPVFELYYPQALSPGRLDRFLAGGWFRSRDFLYRSQMICLEGDVSPVINIRLRLQDFKPSRSLRKILNRNKGKFRYEICDARIDKYKERLYQLSKSRFKGMVVDSLNNFFFEFPSFSVFSTYEVCVYDEEKLVAVSFFDLGANSVASLLGIYDPEYKEYSLGIYTMLLEVEFAKQTEKKFYYPGYVIEGSKIFNYKLRLGNMQFYNWEGRWSSLQNLTTQDWVTHRLKEGVTKMEKVLALHDIASKRYLYPAFTFGYIDILPEYYLKSAVFLACQHTTSGVPSLIVEFFPENNTYRLCYVTEADIEDSDGVEVCEEFLINDVYHLELLGYDEIVFSTPDPELIAKMITENLPENEKNSWLL